MCSSRKNPYPPHGRSLEIPRGKGVKILEAKYEAKLDFPGGGGGGGMGGAKQKTLLHGGSMEIFWNCTNRESLNALEPVSFWKIKYLSSFY